MTLVLAVSLGAGGCGESTKSLVPQDSNPFAEARAGTDSTLEIVTWNLENFAKNGDVTADYVAQAVAALDVDVVAMQEIESDAQFRAVDEALTDWTGYKASSAYADLDLAFLYRTAGKLEVESVFEILTGEPSLPRRPLVLQGTFDGLPVLWSTTTTNAAATASSIPRTSTTRSPGAWRRACCCSSTSWSTGPACA